jgi:hypothetical protein
LPKREIKSKNSKIRRFSMFLIIMSEKNKIKIRIQKEPAKKYMT